MLQRAMTILTEAAQVWPLAARWLDILEKFARDNKGVIPGIEGSMADGVCTIPLQLLSWQRIDTRRQRDPVPEALQSALASSPTARNGQIVGQAIKSDEGQQRNGDPSDPSILPAPPSVPTPMMYIDPNIRAQNPQGQQAQTQAQQAQAMGMSQQQQQQQQQLGGRQTTDGLGLLLEAFDTHQGGANLAAAGGADSYEVNSVANQAGYYGQAGTSMPGNDGYENELQFYIDGAPTVPAWVPGGPGMYGY